MPAEPPLNASVPTKSHDGRTMIGAVVLARIAGEVAVWHVNTAGISTGAWIQTLDGSDATALRLLRLCLQRAVLAWDVTEPLSLLAELAATAGVPPLDWETTALTLPEIVDEIVAARAACDKRVAAERAAKHKVAPIEWPVDVPALVPTTADGFWRATGLILPPSSPVALSALRTCAMARWSAQRWRETMVVVRGRGYLRDELGAPTHLPATWESRAADAFARHTVLG